MHTLLFEFWTSTHFQNSSYHGNTIFSYLQESSSLSWLLSNPIEDHCHWEDDLQQDSLNLKISLAHIATTMSYKIYTFTNIKTKRKQ